MTENGGRRTENKRSIDNSYRNGKLFSYCLWLLLILIVVAVVWFNAYDCIICRMDAANYQTDVCGVVCSVR